MLVYAGIDEAGYGPMFGPLVIARSVFVLDQHDGGGAAEAELPSLWGLLKAAVCKKISDRKRRIAINDSKQVYTPAQGLAHLERGVLSFLAMTGADCRTIDDLLAEVAYDDHSRAPDQLWYLHAPAAGVVPAALDAGQLAIARAQLKRAGDRSGVRCAEINTAVIYEDRFNQMVRATRSKARCSWTFVSGHVLSVWQRFGEHGPHVVIDRQGGRTQYGELLMQLLPDAALTICEEGPLRSVYHLVDRGGRSMTVRVEVNSEQRHLPTALASMSAKYMRELLMMRFNAWWRDHNPQLKPTAGYYKDGKRFLADIEPIMVELGIDPQQVVRAC